MPRGHGIASLAIAPVGTARLTGLLSDGTAFSRTGVLTGAAEFDLFVPLYSGSKGQLTAALTVAPNKIPADTDISASFTWIRPPAPSDGKPHVYPAGFSTNLSALGSRYTPPAPGENVYAAAQSTLTFETTSAQPGSTTVAHTITLNDRSVLSYTGSDKITGAFVESLGLFSGEYTAAGHPRVSIRGVMLSKQKITLGSYLENGAAADFALSR